jgi:hypothetical protein
MSLVTLQVNVSDTTSSGDRMLKIVWNYGSQFAPPYFVRAKTLKDKGEDVRNALQGLIDQGMNNGGSLGRCGKELREVAVTGRALYEALFHQIEGYDATKIREWLVQETANQQRQGNRCQMTFVVESISHIPWGLIYDGSLDILSGEDEQDSINAYEDFWCLKFLLCSVYRRILPHWLTVSHSDEVKEILSVVNRLAFDKASPYLVLPQEDVLKWFEDTFGSPVKSSNDFYERWQARGTKYRLLYFYCHASENSLELDPDDRIKLSDFSERTRPVDSEQRSTCLVFLNGCNTAVGDEDGAFLTTTGEFLFCGFVGTETKVPDVFALRFGLAFLYYFLHEGWPIHKTMDYLRRQHWPLGLAYSSYCSPLLSFTPPDQPLRIEITDNFSHLPLGTRQI